MNMRRSRGAVGGLLLLALGIWGALIPFVGPYFSYGYTPNVAWHFTLNRLWLDLLPGAAVALGGLTLLVAGKRPSAVAGAWLALAGGVWLLVGPAVSLFWSHTSGGLLHSGIGAPLGGHDRAAVEAIGYFYGLGALIASLAAISLGRLSVLPAAAAEATRARPGRFRRGGQPAREPALAGSAARMDRAKQQAWDAPGAATGRTDRGGEGAV